MNKKEYDKLRGLIECYNIQFCKKCDKYTIHIKRGFLGWNRRNKCILCEDK